MKLVIHSVGVWGTPNIRLWVPENPKVIAEDVEIYIGSKSLKGSDIFTIRLATPAGLDTLESKKGYSNSSIVNYGRVRLRESLELVRENGELL